MRCDPVDAAPPPPHDCVRAVCGCLPRRTFLKAASAFTATALVVPTALACDGMFEDEAATKPHRIDVHHHMFPPFVQELWKKSNVRAAPAAMRWTLDDSLNEMNRTGVATTILSVLASGGFNLPRLSIDEHRRLTRRANESAAAIRSEHPSRFGFFAFVPMPDIDGTLKEIEYALDVIKADGIWFGTSYGPKFLGDPDFRVVMDELNRRKAIVYVHPGQPDCCGTLTPGASGSFTEYPQDTNRTVMSLLFSGTFTRTRDIRWIFSHAGATVPLLAGRVNALAKIELRNVAQVLPDGIEFELKRLHYETANASAANMAALLSIVPPSQVLFGTDFPYAPVVDNIDEPMPAGFSKADLSGIDFENARRLFPALTS